MGEARRRKLTGNTVPNPNYRKRKKLTQKEQRELFSEIFGDLTSPFALMNFPQRLAAVRANRLRQEAAAQAAVDSTNP